MQTSTRTLVQGDQPCKCSRCLQAMPLSSLRPIAQAPDASNSRLLGCWRHADRHPCQAHRSASGRHQVLCARGHATGSGLRSLQHGTSTAIGSRRLSGGTTVCNGPLDGGGGRGPCDSAPTAAKRSSRGSPGVFLVAALQLRGFGFLLLIRIKQW
jgi:hypothetical protein